MKIDEYGMYNGYTIAEEIEQTFLWYAKKQMRTEYHLQASICFYKGLIYLRHENAIYLYMVKVLRRRCIYVHSFNKILPL